jgi:hypothetical protein
LLNQGFSLFENKEQFLKAYPPLKWGEYRPQPNVTPASYPCVIREEHVIDNHHGADEAIISIVFISAEINV